MRQKLFPVIQSKKRGYKADIFFFDRFYIILDYFRIGGNDRTVVAVSGRLYFFIFIDNSGIKNGFDSLFYQIFNMAVNNFCRVTG